jgi:hypothetical protein
MSPASTIDNDMLLEAPCRLGALRPRAVIQAPITASFGLFIPQQTHHRKRASNQTLRDPAARDTIGLHLFPQLAGGSVNAFCLPPASGKPSARQAVFDLIGRNARLKRKGNAGSCIPSGT